MVFGGFWVNLESWFCFLDLPNGSHISLVELISYSTRKCKFVSMVSLLMTNFKEYIKKQQT